MSHTTRVGTVKITDIRALRSAIDEMKQKGIKCELLENAKPRMYYREQEVQCDYVLRLNNGKYDVGFEKQADGSYAPIFDELGNYVGNQIGAACPVPSSTEGKAQHQLGQLMQGYAKHAAINAARAKGHMVENVTVDKQGRVKLTITGF